MQIDLQYSWHKKISGGQLVYQNDKDDTHNLHIIVTLKDDEFLPKELKELVALIQKKLDMK